MIKKVFNEKRAFTLAEVLITLSIVGVVAVLTIPGVIKNYRNRLYISQLQKTVAQIENATQSMMNDEHVDSFNETRIGMPAVSFEGADVIGSEYFLRKYFKASKLDCGPKGSDVVSKNCFAIGSNGFMTDEDAYSTITGVSAGGVLGNYCIQTVNGAAICIAYNTANRISTAFIDINGIAEPNVVGRDAFVLDINEDGTVKDSGDSENCNVKVSEYGTIMDYARGCYKSIVEAGWKMEY